MVQDAPSFSARTPTSEDERRALDEKLDLALALSFPASDPPAVRGDADEEQRP